MLASINKQEYLEKFNGRFNLLINNNLTINKKYEKFAQEPIAFHLYKKRLFFHKLITGEYYSNIILNLFRHFEVNPNFKSLSLVNLKQRELEEEIIAGIHHAAWLHL